MYRYNTNELLHCIGFYSRVFLFQNKYEWITSKYSAITVLLYTCVTHHDKKKKTHYFLNNKKIYQKQKQFKKNIFKNIIFKKKVVPAITDICTGGQQCKYQLLSSRGWICLLLFLKNMKACRYHSQILHTHTSWHYEVTVKFATSNMLYLPS